MCAACLCIGQWASVSSIPTYFETQSGTESEAHHSSCTEWPMSIRICLSLPFHLSIRVTNVHISFYTDVRYSSSLLFFLKIYFINICKYTVAVFRHSRRGSQILLWMVVSHHVVAGIWTLDLRKSSRVLLPTEPSHQPPDPPFVMSVPTVMPSPCHIVTVIWEYKWNKGENGHNGEGGFDKRDYIEQGGKKNNWGCLSKPWEKNFLYCQNYI